MQKQNIKSKFKKDLIAFVNSYLDRKNEAKESLSIIDLAFLKALLASLK